MIAGKILPLTASKSIWRPVKGDEMAQNGGLRPSPYSVFLHESCRYPDMDVDDGPPEWAAWLVGCPGRLVLLHGRWKGGKSTYAEGGIAAITRGDDWLDRPTREGSVLVCSEMHPGDVKRTLRQFNADLSRVYVCRPEKLAAAVAAAPVDLVLVVVDTLTTYAEAIGITKLSDPIIAKALMMSLRRAVFDSRPDVALHVQHHNRKAPAGVDEAEARDSTAIMGDADQVVSLLDGEKGDPPTIRRLRSKGRWSEPGATVRLTATGFELVSVDDLGDNDSPTGGGGGGGGRYTRDEVVEYVMQHAESAGGGGLTLNQIQKGLGARSRPAGDEVKRLVKSATYDGLLEGCEVVRQNQPRDGYRATRQHSAGIRQAGVPSAPGEHLAFGTPMCTGVPDAECRAGGSTEEHSAGGGDNAQEHPEQPRPSVSLPLDFDRLKAPSPASGMADELTGDEPGMTEDERRRRIAAAGFRPHVPLAGSQRCRECGKPILVPVPGSEYREWHKWGRCAACWHANPLFAGWTNTADDHARVERAEAARRRTA